jgi:diguanylate cyclase (GGDEF)-like protein
LVLLPDQIRDLYSLAAATPGDADFETACRRLAESLAQILDRPIAIVGLRAGRWRRVASARHVVAARQFATALRRAGTERGFVLGKPITVAGVVWTGVTLWDFGEDRLLLMLGGDWTSSSALLDDTAGRIGAALRPIDSRRRGDATRRLRAALTLSRRLVHAPPARVPEIVAEACARAVGADRASVAIHDARQRVLIVQATYGYPVALVKHLRLRPGAGIIGSVFRSGRPLMNESGGFALERPRSRYRTGALIAMPLLGYEGVLGVVSVCDPAGRASFDRYDLRTLRMLASVGSLALDRVRANEEAEGHSRMAAIDPLTALFNRRHFHSRLEEEVERSRRQSSPLALLMLDVDGLKQLNDRLGHAAGDHVLRTVADVLRRSVRVFDVCTRFGGDEFAILMPGAGPDSSRQVADRIREGVEEFRPSYGPWADDLRVTASIGIATFTGTTAEDLFARADQALYTAKRQGKNRVAIS